MVFVAIQLIIAKPTHVPQLHEFIAVNGQTTNSEFQKVE